MYFCICIHVHNMQMMMMKIRESSKDLEVRSWMQNRRTRIAAVIDSRCLRGGGESE